MWPLLGELKFYKENSWGENVVWTLFQLKLTDVDTNEELVFYINQWFAMDEGDGEIVREFSVDRLGEMSLPCE